MIFIPERSKRINVYDEDKLKQVNPKTLTLIQKYNVYMTLKELSQNTIEQYNADLKQWMIFILDYQGNRSVLELDEDDLEQFFYSAKSGGNNTNRMKRRMSSISAFYNFLIKKRITTENPMIYIDRPKKGQPVMQQTYLSQEQVDQMRKALKKNGNLQLETYALFSLSTMARVNAIANLQWKQINFEKRICENVIEKEGKVVTLYFSKEVKDLLKKMATQRLQDQIDDHGWVFYTSFVADDKPISNGTLDKWCKTIGEMIDEPTLHPHDFRHSGATLLKNKGMSLERVSGLLNHASTDVTQKFYLKADSSKIIDELDKFEI